MINPSLPTLSADATFNGWSECAGRYDRKRFPFEGKNTLPLHEMCSPSVSLRPAKLLHTRETTNSWVVLLPLLCSLGGWSREDS